MNILHCRSYPGVYARQKDIDIVIIRQNTEGEYAMLEHEVIRNEKTNGNNVAYKTTLT